MRAQFHILGFSLFLSPYRASKCHIPNNPFFQYHPSPTEPHGRTFFLTVFSTGVGFCEGVRFADDVIWFLFPYYISVAGSPVEEDKI